MLGIETFCLLLFKNLNILPLYSQCIFSLSTLVVKNTYADKLNSAIYNINTRQVFEYHPPTTKLKKAQKEYITPE
jgi:hypothetical protein